MEFRDYTEITFAAGDILTAQMLEETYRYPREFLHIVHATYGDGILSGLDFESRDGDVYLTAGIVKYRDRFYIHPRDVNLDKWLRLQHLAGGREYFLCLVNSDTTNADTLENGVVSRSKVEVKVFPAREYEDDSILLGKFRFDLNRIHLPSLKSEEEGKPFEEFFQSGLLCLLDVQYAHPQGGTTYHPFLFRAIRDYLEQKKPLSPYDFVILSEIQNHGIVAESTLKSYVAANDKKNSPPVKMTREELFRATTEFLQELYLPSRMGNFATSDDDKATEESTESAWIED
ncbi:MAG: hypothetical protein K6G55_04620 [Selenomonadaceae bacterium]|nr:hypothetical protein [Selenomonadaceae bacterium]